LTIYSELLDRLRSLAYVSAFAGIALPNHASVALHRRVGFEPTGSFPIAGFTADRCQSVAVHLGDADGSARPTSLLEEERTIPPAVVAATPRFAERGTAPRPDRRIGLDLYWRSVSPNAWP
jgi:hypothetical protein